MITHDTSLSPVDPVIMLVQFIYWEYPYNSV